MVDRGEPFGRSAALYDALYADLPTESECDELLSLFAAHGSAPKSLLDLGCGTGRHAVALARRGLHVVGVDRSKEMVAVARRRGVDARIGELRSVRTGTTFDAVAAMFHVVAYVLDDEALSSALATARAHLEAGGLFFFDTWNARAVESMPPEPREKVVVHEGRRIVRRATPVRRALDVEVHYDFEVDGERFVEHHLVRPRDVAKLSSAVVRAGFQVLTADESEESYDLRVLARAV